MEVVMVRSLIAGFGLGLLALAPGCRHPEPDPRDFTVADVPVMAADIRTSEVVQTGALPRQPDQRAAKSATPIRTPDIPP